MIHKKGEAMNKHDVIIGHDSARRGEENYFYCDGTNDSDVIQAAIDYLHAIKPDATFPKSTLTKEKENVS